MSKLRYPSEVAEQIRDVVPEEHWMRFDKLIRDFRYKAPEQQRGCWKRLSLLCSELLPTSGKLKDDWQFEMISILTTKSRKELESEQARG